MKCPKCSSADKYPRVFGNKVCCLDCNLIIDKNECDKKLIKAAIAWYKDKGNWGCDDLCEAIVNHPDFEKN